MRSNPPQPGPGHPARKGRGQGWATPSDALRTEPRLPHQAEVPRVRAWQSRPETRVLGLLCSLSARGQSEGQVCASPSAWAGVPGARLSPQRSRTFSPFPSFQAIFRGQAESEARGEWVPGAYGRRAPLAWVSPSPLRTTLRQPQVPVLACPSQSFGFLECECRTPRGQDRDPAPSSLPHPHHESARNGGEAGSALM